MPERLVFFTSTKSARRLPNTHTAETVTIG